MIYRAAINVCCVISKHIKREGSEGFFFGSTTEM